MHGAQAYGDAADVVIRDRNALFASFANGQRDLALGGVDFSNFFVVLKGTPEETLAAAKAAKDVTLNYGLFINAIINFLIVAFVLFLLIRQINKLAPPPAAAEPATPEDVLLLREIRDSLKK